MAKGMIKREWDEATQTCTAVFPDGQNTSYSFAALPDQIKVDCGCHGMEQKVFDAIAGDIKAGQTYDQIRATLQGQYDQLMAGEWFGKRGSSEGPSYTLVTEAVARMYSVTIEAAKAKLDALTVEQRKAIGQAPKVKVIVDQIRLERSTAKAKLAESVEVEVLENLFA
jgi:hypothetical protein